MRVLAIDTALEACSAAVFDTERGGITASESVAMARGHAEAVMPLLARVMDLAQIEFASLDRIAVTTGPGSFTGLRVGLSVARGIALAANKPAVGITTLTASQEARVGAYPNAVGAQAFHSAGERLSLSANARRLSLRRARGIAVWTTRGPPPGARAP